MSTETSNIEHSTPNAEGAPSTGSASSLAAENKRFSFKARGVCESGNKFSCSGVVIAADAMAAVTVASNCVMGSFGAGVTITTIDVKEKRK